MNVHNKLLSKLSLINQLIFFVVFSLSSSYTSNPNIDEELNAKKILKLFRDNQNIKIDNTAVVLAHADWIATSWQEYIVRLDKKDDPYKQFGEFTQSFIEKVNHKIESLINEINNTVTKRTNYINNWQKDHTQLLVGAYEHSGELERLSLKMSGSEVDPLSRAFESKSRFSIVQQELYQQVTKLQELYCYVCVYNIIYKIGDNSNKALLTPLKTNLESLKAAFNQATINRFSKDRFKDRVDLCIKKLNRVIKLTEKTSPNVESSTIATNLNKEDTIHQAWTLSSNNQKQRTDLETAMKKTRLKKKKKEN